MGHISIGQILIIILIGILIFGDLPKILKIIKLNYKKYNTSKNNILKKKHKKKGI